MTDDASGVYQRCANVFTFEPGVAFEDRLGRVARGEHPPKSGRIAVKVINHLIIEGFRPMQLHAMEEQLKNIDARTTKSEQILPTLATKEDLRLTTEDLRQEMAKFATKQELTAGLEDAKRYTLLLIQVTRGEIRQIREEMATKGDLQRLEMTTKRDLQQLQRALSKQIATLRAPSRKSR